MLPEGVEELLPVDAWRLEALRRRLLDLYRESGFELVMPPLIEHLDALLTGAGRDLEAQTFKLTDPASGRLLGLRADMTPQVARIAARQCVGREAIRLCYLGTVLRTFPDGPGGPRAPMQVGCEIFGESAPAADIRIMDLMLRTLAAARVPQVQIALGHLGIYRALVEPLALDEDAEAELFDILQRKSAPDLTDFLAANQVDETAAAAVCALIELSGPADTVAQARQRLPANAVISGALDELAAAASALSSAHPEVGVHIDLAELRGYRYQTGMVFAAFVPGHGREVARGGRYDGAGREFGRSMPATGFSADLDELLRLGAAS
jgi:ATP phosphoribosyltransferase, regulatory subunit